MKTNQYKCLDKNEMTTPTKEELEAWLDSYPPLSDDDIRAMSAYYDSENFMYEESLEKTMEKYK